MKIKTLVWVGLLCAPAGLFAQAEKKISLIDALKTAVEQNLEVQLQKLSVDTSDLNLEQTKAVYEPLVSGYLNADTSNESPQTSTQGDDNFVRKSHSFQTKAEKSEDFGLKYNVEFSADKYASTQSDRVGDTAYYTNITLGIEQKLLKGFALDWEVLRKDRFLAIAARDISQTELTSRIHDVLQRTENAYWDLVDASEQLKVAQQSLELANQLYQQNKVKIEVGTLAPIELVNTEATVAQREKDIVDAENAVGAAEDQLKKVMNLPPAQWSNHFVPTEEAKYSALKINIDDALAYAYRNRPEMQKFNFERRKAELEYKYAKNQLLPGLVFSSKYNSKGSDFGVKANSAAGIEERASSLNTAVSQAFSNELPGYSFNLSASWHPFNKQGKISLAKSEVLLRQVELQTKQAELDVTEQVRSSVRELDAVQKALFASEKALKFREESLKAEEQKFQNGLSTNYRVAEEQELLARAKSDLIKSKVRYQKALVAYYKSLGKLTEERGIQLP